MDEIEGHLPGAMASGGADHQKPATIHIEGRFDEGAALRLRSELRDAAATAAIDFSRVTGFEDRTIALLATTLVASRLRMPTMRLIGISDHQRRLLHHFGIAIAPKGTVDSLLNDEASFTD